MSNRKPLSDEHKAKISASIRARHRLDPEVKKVALQNAAKGAAIANAKHAADRAELAALRVEVKALRAEVARLRGEA